MEFKKAISVKQMGLALDLGRRKAYELANRKDFPSFRIGTKLLVSQEGLEKWIEEQIRQRQEGV